VAVPDLDFRTETYDSPASRALTAEVQREYVERYGGPDEGPIAAAEFEGPHGVFVVGYVGEEPVAMAGLRRHGEVGAVELKRMFVRPGWRGQGLSRVLLAEMERRAADLGAARVILETGQRQPEALALYRSSGYEPIAPFGYYAEAPLSVCLGKRVPSGAVSE
jgi:GNAT superfamily N-acetyltransferase